MGLATILFKMHAAKKDITSCAEKTAVGGFVAMPFACVVGSVSTRTEDLRQAHEAIWDGTTIPRQTVHQPTRKQHHPAWNTHSTLVATHDMGLPE